MIYIGFIPAEKGCPGSADGCHNQLLDYIYNRNLRWSKSLLMEISYRFYIHFWPTVINRNKTTNVLIITIYLMILLNPLPKMYRSDICNSQALPTRPTCFSSREATMATTSSPQPRSSLQPQTAPLPPCQTSGPTTRPSSLLETSRWSPPVEDTMATISPPAWSWTRAPASGRRTGLGRCCRRENSTQP